jgi:acyl carrier protein
MSLNRDETLAMIARRLPYLARKLRPEARLAALGLDSLDEVELLLVSEQLFGVRLEVDDLQTALTVGELADRISARANEVPQP